MTDEDLGRVAWEAVHTGRLSPSWERAGGLRAAYVQMARAVREALEAELDANARDLLGPLLEDEEDGSVCPECHGLWAHMPDCPLRPVRNPSDPRVP